MLRWSYAKDFVTSMLCLYWILIAVDQVWPAHCDGPPQLHWRLSRPLPRWQHLLSVWADAHDNVLLYFNVCILSQNCIENKSRGLRFSQSRSNRKWCYNKVYVYFILKIPILKPRQRKRKSVGSARSPCIELELFEFLFHFWKHISCAKTNDRCLYSESNTTSWH